MLDYASLKAPAEHGGVLVSPDARSMTLLARRNADALHDDPTPFLDSTVGEYRRKTRRRILGADDQPIVVIGHQPTFLHAGVWAKHVTAARLASAMNGHALNLVVDSDVPASGSLEIPVLQDGDVNVRRVDVHSIFPGQTYEQIPCLRDSELERVETQLREMLGERFERSHFPLFFQGTRRIGGARNWVDQFLAGRHEIDSRYRAVLRESRVSRSWWMPFLAELLIRAERFAASYNLALAWYRRSNRVRGRQRPMPDLMMEDHVVELPFWMQRGHEGRRRLFVVRDGGSWRLRAGDCDAGRFTRDGLMRWIEGAPAHSEIEGWRIRPRALALTIWARLLLADLFIHGIGGAKYDRLADRIIADFFQIAPPAFACVSATLHLKLPRRGASRELVRRRRRELRDLQWNPQRHVCGGPDVDALLEQRRGLIERVENVRNANSKSRRESRSLFREVRELNAAILRRRADAARAAREAVDSAVEDLRRDRLACGREYFIGLHDEAALSELTDALPAPDEFRV